MKLLCMCRVLSMARFAGEAELKAFLGRLDQTILNLHLQCGKLVPEQGINLHMLQSHFCCLVVCQSCTSMNKNWWDT